MKNFTKVVLIVIIVVLIGIFLVLFNSWRIARNVQVQGTQSVEYQNASADIRAKGNAALIEIQKQQTQK